MLFAKYTSTQLICLSTPLPTICEWFAHDTASCGIGIGVGISVVGGFVNVLVIQVSKYTPVGRKAHYSHSNLPSPLHDVAPVRQTWTRRCPRRSPGTAEPLRLQPR